MAEPTKETLQEEIASLKREKSDLENEVECQRWELSLWRDREMTKTRNAELEKRVAELEAGGESG